MDEAPASPLGYYASQGPITDPGAFAALFDGLPRAVPALCEVVQGLMIHRAFAEFYGLAVSDERSEDAELRHVSHLLSRIIEVDGRLLASPRPPEKRLLIVCRDFATMLCAMLRHQGIPARARCGFARYFGQCPDSTPGFNVDHWVCEIWDPNEERWVLVDAEVDENERGFCHIEIDTLDVPRDQFLVAGRAWQLCRSGHANPDDFGLAPDSMHGLWYIQSQLVRDLAAMNKMELLCWDCWGLGHADPNEDLLAQDMALLDRVAVLTQAGNEAFTELRAIYEYNQQLRVPSVVISYDGAEPRQVDLNSP
ncbi:MAG: transglutaminase-like domain-containing protein [Anaerolineae bacterium]